MRQSNICAIVDLNVPDDALKPLTKQRPVGTLPFAGRYRLLDFALSDIANAGIRDVGLYMPASSRSVQDHIRSGSTWNLDTIVGGIFTFPYVATKNYDDSKNRQRYYDDYLSFLKRSNTRFTVVISGRNIENINLDEVLRFHMASHHDMTVLYKRQGISEVQAGEEVLDLTPTGDVIQITEAQRLIDQHDGPTLPMAMGVYMLRTDLLIELLQTASSQEDFVRLPAILRTAVSTYHVNAYEYTGFYAHINTIKRYYDANMAILNEVNYQALLYSERHVFTKNKNEVPTFFASVSDVNNSLLGTGSQIYGQINESVIFRHVQVALEAQINRSIIMQGSKIGAGSKLSHVILDKGVEVGPNLELIGTPEHPLVFGKNEIITESKQSELVEREVEDQ